MANVNIPYGQAGVAAFEQGDTFSQAELFNSAIPQPVTEDFEVAASTTLVDRAVVGLDATGKLVMAKTSSTAVVPIGVVPDGGGIVTDASNPKRIPIYRAGNFNPVALIYHADYDTLAKKCAAFRNSPTPTNIVVRPRL